MVSFYWMKFWDCNGDEIAQDESCIYHRHALSIACDKEVGKYRKYLYSTYEIHEVYSKNDKVKYFDTAAIRYIYSLIAMMQEE